MPFGVKKVRKGQDDAENIPLFLHAPQMLSGRRECQDFCVSFLYNPINQAFYKYLQENPDRFVIGCPVSCPCQPYSLPG